MYNQSCSVVVRRHKVFVLRRLELTAISPMLLGNPEATRLQFLVIGRSKPPRNQRAGLPWIRRLSDLNGGFPH